MCPGRWSKSSPGMRERPSRIPKTKQRHVVFHWFSLSNLYRAGGVSRPLECLKAFQGSPYIILTVLALLPVTTTPLHSLCGGVYGGAGGGHAHRSHSPKPQKLEGINLGSFRDQLGVEYSEVVRSTCRQSLTEAGLCSYAPVMRPLLARNVLAGISFHHGIILMCCSSNSPAIVDTCRFVSFPTCHILTHATAAAFRCSLSWTHASASAFRSSLSWTHAPASAF